MSDDEVMEMGDDVVKWDGLWLWQQAHLLILAYHSISSIIKQKKTTTNYNFILYRVLLEKPVFMKLVRHILFSQKLHKHCECFFHVFLFPSLLGVISVMNMN